MKALFLDRDGTLIVDHPYQNNREKFQILGGVTEGLQKLSSSFVFFIVTNQSGIGRGLTNWEDLNSFNEFLVQEFLKFGVKFEQIFVCPHRPDENCNCRKPSVTKLLPLADKYGINFAESFVIGDKQVDIELGKNLGAHSILVLTGQGLHELEKARLSHPRFVAADFRQAALFIGSQPVQKILDRMTVKSWADAERAKSQRIVTINGTFDILHAGHEKILCEARAQGDLLLVALNSDASVRGYKGESRPINSLLSRQRMMASFDFVDFVTSFEESTPLALLEDIRPAVHVNGSEYGENCIEAPIVKKYGGRIHIIKLVEGLSTTKLLEKAFRSS